MGRSGHGFSSMAHRRSGTVRMMGRMATQLQIALRLSRRQCGERQQVRRSPSGIDSAFMLANNSWHLGALLQADPTRSRARACGAEAGIRSVAQRARDSYPFRLAARSPADRRAPSSGRDSSPDTASGIEQRPRTAARRNTIGAMRTRKPHRDSKENRRHAELKRIGAAADSSQSCLAAAATSGSAFRSAQAFRSAVNLDLAGDLQRLAVEAQYGNRSLDHVLR